MEARIAKLESEVATLITDVAVIRSNYATKADIAALEAKMVKWFIATAFGMTGLMIALAGLAFAAGRYIH